MAEGKRLTTKDLELTHASPVAATLKDAREELERDMIQSALRRHGGRIAPRRPGTRRQRPTLYDLMEKLGIGKDLKS